MFSKDCPFLVMLYSTWGGTSGYTVRLIILSIAAAQYSAIDSREYETVRLRRVFSGRQPMTALDAELLQSSVSAIHCHNDGSLNIKLKNRQVIGKE